MATSSRPAGTLECRSLTMADRAEWARLLGISFGRTADQMERLLAWFHAGFQLVTWGAWDGDRLVAQYNCRLLELEVPGHARPVLAGMGLNMAVDPDYRGRGLLQTVATPVHEEIARRGCVAGVGFSSAGGLAVTRSSGTYAYRVLGPMTSTVGLIVRRGDARGLELTEDWPGDVVIPRRDDGLVRYHWTAAMLRHRFAEHPFRRYTFGAWREGGLIVGLTVHRETRLRGVPAIALLAACGADLDQLLSRWAGAIRARGPSAVHVVTSPAAILRKAIRAIGPSVAVPISRDRYHLIARPLRDDAPAQLFELNRWDCSGGDIL
jgi:GNAT superfamily N-acetyltransferase